MNASPDPTGHSGPPWYESAFQHDYLERYRKRDQAQADAEVETVTSRIPLNAVGPVLDLCCGGGRHLRPLREQSVDAYGVDLSAPLLEEARRRAAGVDRGRFARADMRALPFGPCFGAVLSFFTSFGYFENESENDRVLAEVSRVLVSGGIFMLDLMDRETTVRDLIPESQRQEGDQFLRERRWITPDGRRVEKESRLSSDSDRAVSFESVRLFGFEEIQTRFAEAGLEILEAWGSFSGEPYRSGKNPRMILVARKESR